MSFGHGRREITRLTLGDAELQDEHEAEMAEMGGSMGHCAAGMKGTLTIEG